MTCSSRPTRILVQSDARFGVLSRRTKTSITHPSRETTHRVRIHAQSLAPLVVRFPPSSKYTRLGMPTRADVLRPRDPKTGIILCRRTILGSPKTAPSMMATPPSCFLKSPWYSGVTFHFEEDPLTKYQVHLTNTHAKPEVLESQTDQSFLTTSLTWQSLRVR